MRSEDPTIFSTIRAEKKDVSVDVKKYDNGVYLKISERNRAKRSTILIPASSLAKLESALAEASEAIRNERYSSINLYIY